MILILYFSEVIALRPCRASSGIRKLALVVIESDLPLNVLMGLFIWKSSWIRQIWAKINNFWKFYSFQNGSQSLWMKWKLTKGHFFLSLTWTLNVLRVLFIWNRINLGEILKFVHCKIPNIAWIPQIIKVRFFKNLLRKSKPNMRMAYKGNSENEHFLWVLFWNLL